ncbi:zinc-containing alcohol dehydrogenase superfamily, partial [mine drainage metagenome]
MWTYNSKDSNTGKTTYGGYSDKIVVDRRFVIKFQSGKNLPGMAPILCAGITTYSPLKKYGVGPGKNVAVAGLGGLGHMAVKIASSMGANVTVFTSSENKINEAKRLGASEVVAFRSRNDLKGKNLSFDLIMDTIPANHDINALMSTLKPNGTLVLVGLPEKSVNYTLSPFILTDSNRSVSGSNIGGIPETQEIVDFCQKHDIRSDVEIIPFNGLDEAYNRITKNDVKYR